MEEITETSGLDLADCQYPFYEVGWIEGGGAVDLPLSLHGDADVDLAETSTSVLGHQCGLDLGLACYLLFEQIQHKQMRNLVSSPYTLQEHRVLPR